MPINPSKQTYNFDLLVKLTLGENADQFDIFFFTDSFVMKGRVVVLFVEIVVVVVIAELVVVDIIVVVVEVEIIVVVIVKSILIKIVFVVDMIIVVKLVVEISMYV